VMGVRRCAFQSLACPPAPPPPRRSRGGERHTVRSWRHYFTDSKARNVNAIMTKSDWDYRGLAAECYDLWFGAEPFWDQPFFYQRLCRNGRVALEIACGTGRLLMPLLRDGLAVDWVVIA